ncbi:MAG: Prevent-host-death family protein putative antitoxin of system [Acidimicrobiales bacterium]|nr:Prevent-host-death family protein putative antitoxin of system [Acidimicrobiales bacterium]
MAIEEVSIRDLRNHGGEVVDRVEHGGRVVVTRSGRPVAELRPLAKAPIRAASLIERWRKLPVVDPERLRHDIDTLIDGSL